MTSNSNQNSPERRLSTANHGRAHITGHCLSGFVSCLLLLGNASQTIADPQRPVLERCGECSILLGGHLESRINAVVENWLLKAPDANPAMLEMFADRDREPYRDLLPWSGEFAGKYLTSATEVLRLSRDARLKQRLARFVSDLISKQDVDGYLGPFPRAYRFTGKAPNIAPRKNTWDAWGHYHAMLGLILYHQESHDPAALECARRIGDMLCREFADSHRAVSTTGSPEMNQAIVHSLALLHKCTREDRYLELAQAIVRDFQSPSAGDYLRAGLNGTPFFQTRRPRWESLHAVQGLAELYWITGNDDYRRAFEHLWWSIVQYDRHNNGGFSSGERAQGNPYDPRPIETCCTIAWTAMTIDMLRLTGNPVVADELELSTLNQIVGLHAPDCSWSTYNTPMDGERIPSTVEIAFQIRPGSEQLNCCSVNAARGFGMISDWAVMRSADGLAINWYGPSEFATVVNNVRVSLQQRTGYPFDGHISLIVTPASETRFTLKLRIPHWSWSTKATVNGEPMQAVAGNYLAIDRAWKAGDEIVLDLDMRIRGWVGERECEGKLSLYRGPLLLAFEHGPGPQISYSEQWKKFGNNMATESTKAVVDFWFEGTAIEWHGAYFDDAGKACISIDGKDVAVVDQYGTKRGKPFVWKHDSLAPGKHRLRLEVLGEKSAASKGAWVNVDHFETDVQLPQLSAATVSDPVEVRSDPSGRLTIVVNALGHENVELHDFGTVGANSRRYSSWLPVKNVAAIEFSRQNPTRSAPLNR